MGGNTFLAILIGSGISLGGGQADSDEHAWPANIRMVIQETRPLEFDRGNRLPLYLWPAMAPSGIDDAMADAIIRALNRRGVGLISSWNPDEKERQGSLADALRIARIQTRLGLRVNVNAIGCLYSFFNGDPRTAHIDEAGKPFWDSSFGKKMMGCPFTLDFRRPAIRERTEYFVRAYKKSGMNLDFVFGDWEVDGPLEVNRAHAASMRCRRCRDCIPGIEDFGVFQKTLRELRGELQRECYSQPILSRFSDALVGNYAVYPHGGLRYWYDYFEYFVEGQPSVTDGRAKYRRWYQEFPATDYTFAMPVVYTWYPTFNWYDFDDPDYRWFYNLLLVTSNAGKHTPAEVPIISFVHWHTTAPPPDRDPKVKQFSETNYRELLWHMLFRGTDTFFLWSPAQEARKEVQLLHPVYAAAQEYGEFLEKGVPITFEIPRMPRPVVSGLQLGKLVLVRRTDFGPPVNGPVELKIGTATLAVPRAAGRCQILKLP